jgi:hypothetical protein
MRDKSKFTKLFSTMGEKTPVANKGIDDKMLQNRELQNQLQMIDDKIAQLEESDDPNALESINFWKQRRAKLAGE